MANTKQPKTVQELDEQVRKQTLLDMTNTIESIYDDLVVTKKNNILPEQIFVKEFLPLFYGAVEDKDVRFQQIQSWISIAGSPSSEVSIVDVDNNVLFDVPPVINSSSIDIVSRGDKDIGKIFESFSADNFPIRGNRNLLSELDNKQEDIISQTDKSKKEAYERMNQIFVRYGLDTKVSKQTSNEDTSDFEYE